jgi:hypothetical protein
LFFQINNNEDKEMKTSSKFLMRALATAVAVSGISLISLQAMADEAREGRSPPTTNNENAAVPSGEEEVTNAAVSANMYFTDKNGKPRNPTAEEIRETARAFQQDLARLAGPHKGKTFVNKRPDGTVSAVVATSQLVFLSAQQEDDGTLTFGHSTVGDDGNLTFEPATDLPEK